MLHVNKLNIAKDLLFKLSEVRCRDSDNHCCMCFSLDEKLLCDLGISDMLWHVLQQQLLALFLWQIWLSAKLDWRLLQVWVRELHWFISGGTK